ncbi:class I adenylate-forming enzyme family protein [Microbacterium gorillae]|uniref:class I adenylate-forming enzyme family protein n=1 Tax=Microbacterium gorillae TaxID=1231063 RepID=UPI0005911A42|nr:class I adenylate-forming enzyme family protein [Microbacterium gorillae]
MSESSPVWGTDIAVEQVDGIAFRMYRDRPRRLEELLDLGLRWADRPHLVQGERVVTFADLHAAVGADAARLQAVGVAPGDRVLLLGWNGPEWIVHYWAITACGAVPVLANAWWSETELAHAVATLAPAAVVVDPRLDRPALAGITHAAWDLAEAEGAPAHAVAHGDEDAPAVVIFTSGTEGHPKAVELTHRALLAGLQMLLHITKRMPHQVQDTDGEAALHTGPMFHIGGVQTLLRSVIVGDTLVMPAGRFDPAEALRLIEAWGIRRWSAVPTMVTRVIEHPDARTRDLSTLRALTMGGAPVGPELLARTRAGLPGITPRIATGYGLTENGGQAVAASGADTTSRPGATGRALPCVELAIAPRESGDGEILVRSPTQMRGYLGTDAVSPIDSAGWLHTGDLGRIDEDGYLWITGRSKDMIIRGGENIAPAAIEEALAAMPGVREAVVFGIPHAELGEEVVAVVVAAGEVDETALAAGVRSAIASFAVPSRWVVLDEPLPTNHAGKIDKPRVVREIGARLTAEVAG